ncbi:Diphthamide biosynthesis protein 2 [Galdieria sulphuraria]|nr:Diphthamide biosynthesis protein 2 [Galdieria sulphuraria]
MPTEQLQFVRTNNWFPVNLNATTTLKRRLALISKAQKSHVFGIVVSAIATKGVLDAIERCEVLLNQFEMEWYLLNVGKPTPTKLGNFPEIEVFVLVGCPESAFLDSKSYMKPILTMAELELALDSRLYFTDIGSIHDFQDTLSRPFVARKQMLDDENEDIDKFYEETTANALSEFSMNRDLIAYDISSTSTAAFLRHRSWKGVEEEPNEENEPHTSKEGHCGIPSGYSNEGSRIYYCDPIVQKDENYKLFGIFVIYFCKSLFFTGNQQPSNGLKIVNEPCLIVYLV